MRRVCVTRPGSSFAYRLVMLRAAHEKARPAHRPGFRLPAGLIRVAGARRQAWRGRLGRERVHKRKAETESFGTHVVVQRCQRHKREHAVRYLPTTLQPARRRKLQAAYAEPTPAAAPAALSRLHRELRLVNASAAAGLTEGLKETRTLHRLGVFREVGTSFKTTTLLESVMARVEARSHRATRWRTSDPQQRWCAAALLALEAPFHRVTGHAQLPLLHRARRRTMPHSIELAA